MSRILVAGIIACTAVGSACCSPRDQDHDQPLPVAALSQRNQELPAWPSPEAAGLDPVALRKFVDGARDSHADAVVVVKSGRVVLEEYSGDPGPIATASVTKSIVSLAVGVLLDEGFISSLDQPVSEFYPEWKQGKKQRITLRHLLAHTSGLQNVPEVRAEVAASPDAVQLALAAELSSDPGTTWAYNNKAVGLLAGIVRKASGQPLDDYVRSHLFAPMGITDFSWVRDRAGTPYGMMGLKIRPRDLARIGEMLADGGQWRGRRIVSPTWIEVSALTQGQAFRPDSGLLWWLAGGEVEFDLIDEEGLAKLRTAGVDSFLLKKISNLKGVVARSDEEALSLVEKQIGPGALETWKREVMDRGVQSRARRLSPPTAVQAQGSGGQYMRVWPKERLVVVCMHRTSSMVASGISFERLEFADFNSLAKALPAASAER